jgi:cytidyltransferase-like protein
MSSMRLWIIQRRTFTTGDFMEKTVTYAVVVGRFQVSALHQGHKYLLTAAATQAEKLIVVIGVTERTTYQYRSARLQDERTTYLA